MFPNLMGKAKAAAVSDLGVGYQFKTSGGKVETIYGLKIHPVGLIVESTLDNDQKLLSVLVPGTPYDFGLHFNGADATVSWGVVSRMAPGVPAQPLMKRRGVVDDGTSWALDSRVEALALYEYLANQLRMNSAVPKKDAEVYAPSTPGKSRLRKAVEITLYLIAGFVVFSMLFALFNTAEKAAQVTSAPAPAAQSPAFTPMDAGIPDDARASAAEIEQIKALKGTVAMRATGIPFYVFTDPNCPFCLELEKNLAQLDSKFNPVMIPLGFKDGSMNKSASVLCLDENKRAKAWGEMMSGAQEDARACEAGGAFVAENQMLFGQLRLTATPTIVTPTGIFVSGSAKADELAVILSK